jgi:hypothetical protein
MTEQQNDAGPQDSGAQEPQAGPEHDGKDQAADQAAPGDGQPGEDQAGGKELRGAYRAERKQRIELQKQLAELQRKSMSDSERAIAEAREQGRTEARAEAARRIAAAEFRSAANGKLADPDAALELLDLGRLVGDDGEPDPDAIKAVIERLAPATAAPGQQPRVPAGPRDTQPETDFIRARLAAQRG